LLVMKLTEFVQQRKTRRLTATNVNHHSFPLYLMEGEM